MGIAAPLAAIPISSLAEVISLFRTIFQSGRRYPRESVASNSKPIEKKCFKVRDPDPRFIQL